MKNLQHNFGEFFREENEDEIWTIELKLFKKVFRFSLKMTKCERKMILVVLCLSVFGLTETEQKLLQKIENMTGKEAQICNDYMANHECPTKFCYDSSERIKKVCY